MENINIVEFFTPDKIDMFKQLIISAFCVMMVAQTTKKFIDKLIIKLPFVKKKPSTNGYVFVLSLVQAILFMFSFNSYPVTATNIYITIINACLLYVGCTKSFEFVFKNISIKANKNEK